MHLCYEAFPDRFTCSLLCPTEPHRHSPHSIYLINLPYPLLSLHGDLPGGRDSVNFVLWYDHQNHKAGVKQMLVEQTKEGINKSLEFSYTLLETIHIFRPRQQTFRVDLLL